MPDTFERRLDVLEQQVGSGTLQGSMIREQPYAAAEEVYLHHHHDVGQAFYTTTAFVAGYRDWYQHLATNLLRGDLTQAMIENMNDFDRAATRLAPVTTRLLKRSGGVYVSDGTVLVHHRPQEGAYNWKKTRGVPG